MPRAAKWRSQRCSTILRISGQVQPGVEMTFETGNGRRIDVDRKLAVGGEGEVLPRNAIRQARIDLANE
jgi:hypothetical protein